MSRTILFFVTMLLGVLLSSCGGNPLSNDGNLNIIFIMSDDHAYQAISSYDSSLIQTPNIDRLAEGGIVFGNSFVTNSICGPSRAVLMTGKFSHKNGFKDNTNYFDSSQVTFPKLLREAGYQTAMVGKWHLRSQPTGFDYWNVLPGQGHYYNPDFIEMGEKKRIEGYVTDITTDIAKDWLDSRDREKPFCLLLHHKAPHRNWQPDTSYFGIFDNKEFPEPVGLFDDYDGREAAAQQEMTIKDHMGLVYDLKMEDPEGEVPAAYPAGWLSWTLDRMNPVQRKAWDRYYAKRLADFKEKAPKGEELVKWKYQAYMEDYLSCIASVDDNVGRLLDYLEEEGLDENTIVVYTSDQGFYLGEHGWFDKRFMYEESMRMPLIMKIPGAEGTRDENRLVQNIDFAPTFLDIAGVDVPDEMHGLSLKSMLLESSGLLQSSGTENKPAEWRKSLYYHYYEYPGAHSVKRHYGVRTDRYKLIHFYDDIDNWELFDLEKDPGEMNNIAGAAEYADIMEEMKVELLSLATEYGDSIGISLTK